MALGPAELGSRGRLRVARGLSDRCYSLHILSFLSRAMLFVASGAFSQDLVAICLVCHELPQAATANILREACRILRKGGALAIMEMNPRR